MKVIIDVVKSISLVIDKVDKGKPDHAYVTSPLWTDVVEKAKIAYQYIKDQGMDNEDIERLETHQ